MVQERKEELDIVKSEQGVKLEGEEVKTNGLLTRDRKFNKLLKIIRF